MNRSRIIIMALAACAAIVVAFVVRGFLGGGTQPVRAAVASPPVMTQNVLVASNSIQPGTALTPELVHWQAWPKNLVDLLSSLRTVDRTSPMLRRALLCVFRLWKANRSATRWSFMAMPRA